MFLCWQKNSVEIEKKKEMMRQLESDDDDESAEIEKSNKKRKGSKPAKRQRLSSEKEIIVDEEVRSSNLYFSFFCFTLLGECQHKIQKYNGGSYTKHFKYLNVRKNGPDESNQSSYKTYLPM